MKIQALSFGIAGAITTSIWYVCIAFALQIWPYDFLKFISSSHMIPRLENIAPYIKISSSGIFIGVATHFFFSFLFFWLIAFIYNVCSSTKNH